MPSLLKTAFLQLNKWAGNEYPKRDDFVSDNEKIDTAIKNHDTQLAQKVSKTGDTMTGNLNVPTINSKTPAYAITPTETLITSGFATGWSGGLRLEKNQEKLVTLNIYALKSTDIVADSSTINNIPIGYRPKNNQEIIVNTVDVNGFILSTLVKIVFEYTGNILVQPLAGTNLANARVINNFSISYYTT